LGFLFNIAATAGAIDFKFCTPLGFAQTHHKITPTGKAWPWAWEFSFNISATAEVSDYKFGTQLGFARCDHKITPREKSSRGLRIGEVSEILGFPNNISAMTEANEFKFGAQLGLAKDHYKITCRRNGGVAVDWGSSPKFGGSPSIFTQWLKLVTSNSVHSLGLPRPIINSHLEEKIWSGHGIRGAPK